MMFVEEKTQSLDDYFLQLKQFCQYISESAIVACHRNPFIPESREDRIMIQFKEQLITEMKRDIELAPHSPIDKPPKIKKKKPADKKESKANQSSVHNANCKNMIKARDTMNFDLELNIKVLDETIKMHSKQAKTETATQHFNKKV